MLQNPRKTLGFKKNMVYKIPPGGGGKPYPASGLIRTKKKVHKSTQNMSYRLSANLCRSHNAIKCRFFFESFFSLILVTKFYKTRLSCQV